MSLRERIEKAIRALRKDLDKDFPNPGVLSKDQQTDADDKFVLVTEEIEEHLKESAAYGDIPDLELIEKVERAAKYVEKRALLFRQSGDGWEISYKDGKKFFLKDAKGLNCLAHLLAKPHQPISVLALNAAVEKHLPPDTPYSKMSKDALEAQGLQLGEEGGDAVIDAKYKKQLADRIKEINDQMESARLQEDDANEEMLQAELDEILDQFSKATGLGGKSRKFSGDAEKARINLTMQIKTAIEKMRQHNPELAKHLDDTIETGSHCAYRPVGDMSWEMS